jgi:hypothetical protein
VVQQHSSQFDFLHYSAAITHLAQLEASAGRGVRNHAASVLVPSASSSHQEQRRTPEQVPQRAHIFKDGDKEELLALLLDGLAARLAQLRARELANILWAAARLSCPSNHPGLVRLADAAWRAVSSMNGQELSNTLYAAALLGLAPPPAIARGPLQRAMQAVMPHCGPQAQSNMLWALGRLHLHPDGSTQHALLQATYHSLYQMTPRVSTVSIYLTSISCVGAICFASNTSLAESAHWTILLCCLKPSAHTLPPLHCRRCVWCPMAGPVCSSQPHAPGATGCLIRCGDPWSLPHRMLTTPTLGHLTRAAVLQVSQQLQANE